MDSLALRCQMTWTEDRATQRCDPSADPGAETGVGAKHSFAPLPSPLRFWRQSDKPSWQDATKFFAGCASPLANARGPKFQFTVNQYSSYRLKRRSRLLCITSSDNSCFLRTASFRFASCSVSKNLTSGPSTSCSDFGPETTTDKPDCSGSVRTIVARGKSSLRKRANTSARAFGNT